MPEFPGFFLANGFSGHGVMHSPATGRILADLILNGKGTVDMALVRRYLTYMKTTVSSKGQIVLPAEFRRMDRVKPGQEFDIERLDRGEYRLHRRATANEGAIDWLLACPHKDYFVPIDSESTDVL